MENAVLSIVFVIASFIIALSALLAFAMFQKRQGTSLGKQSKSEQNKVTFLFEDDTLVDSTPAAQQILNNSNANGNDWSKFVSIFKPRFDDLEMLALTVLENGPTTLTSADKTSRLEADLSHGVLRLDLSDAETAEGPVGLDRHSLLALKDELSTYRATAEKVPYLNWRENEFGEIIWANTAYLDITEIVHATNSAPAWPPARLFEGIVKSSASDTQTTKQRMTLSIPGEDQLNWFEIHLSKMEGGTLFTAIPIDQVVKAEATLSEFVTTLTGTFAHLPIGLAIFDANRKLSLFNPALTDLSMLPAEFLCGQPTLFSFLDLLREKRMMPEPKDYKTWRQEMSELEENAVKGTYCETWFLPTGQTYRVTGRPHPGGSLALLLEDITSEISLTHRFQAELEMGRAVLDNLVDAVAVFTGGGVLSMANSAYADLWGTDPSTTLDDINISEATTIWSRQSHPTAVWQQLQTYIREQGERKKWEAPVSLKDGRVLRCCFTPMIEGATLVTFAYPKQKPNAHKLEPLSAVANS